MGTFYKLADGKDANEGEFGLDEMSNRLALVFCDDTGTWNCTKKMSPEEIVKILLYGLTVCSYWMDSNKLKELILNYVNKEL